MDGDDEDTLRRACAVCGNIGFGSGEDGFFYCVRCGSQAEDVVEMGVADEDFVEKALPGGDKSALYSAIHTRRRPVAPIKSEPISTYPSQNQSQLWSRLAQFGEEPTVKVEIEPETHYPDFDFEDGIGPTEPADFGGSQAGLGYEDYYGEVRMRYVLGLQMMVQLQCGALVRGFGVSKMVCGLSGTLWLRFVAESGVFRDEWADDIFQETESQKQDTVDRGDFRPRAKFRAEPHTLHGQRAIMIWYRSLRKKIPLSSSLAISFLACHIVREAILPTDILKWSVEGKLPYFAAFLDIEKEIGPPSSACPLSSSVMFRPSHAIGVQRLESSAAAIAETIGLHLPPVNFYGIASRYLHHMSLPIKKILPHACKIHEWSMPPELWLSVNDLRLPTRVSVMSILIVAIRILYNINGFGAWEKSFQRSSKSAFEADEEHGLEQLDSDNEDEAEKGSGSPMDQCNTNTSRLQKSYLDASKLLRNLDRIYKEIGEKYDFSKDFPTYLQYCNDVIFAGQEPSFADHEEDRMTRQLWDFYQKEKDPKPMESQHRKRLREEDASETSEENNKTREDGKETSHSHDSPQQSLEGDQGSESCSQAASESERDEAIRRIKTDMEESIFHYVPPRRYLKRFDYLYYARKKKKGDGHLTYIAHADYYILLRACARVVQVDIRTMHDGVLSFERRLDWLEKRIDHCLQLTPPDETCEHCNYVHYPPENDDDNPIDLSNLSV